VSAVPIQELDPWLTKSESAEYLRVDERSIERYCELGILPGYRIGPRLVRFRRSDLDALARPIPVAVGQ
jgi:excisionase family DNA binding protein